GRGALDRDVLRDASGVRVARGAFAQQLKRLLEAVRPRILLRLTTQCRRRGEGTGSEEVRLALHRVIAGRLEMPPRLLDFGLLPSLLQAGQQYRTHPDRGTDGDERAAEREQQRATTPRGRPGLHSACRGRLRRRRFHGWRGAGDVVCRQRLGAHRPPPRGLPLRPLAPPALEHPPIPQPPARGPRATGRRRPAPPPPPP